MKLADLRPTVKASLALMFLVSSGLASHAIETENYYRAMWTMAISLVFFIFYGSLRFNMTSWNKFVETIDNLIYTRKMRPQVDDLQKAIDEISEKIDKDSGVTP